MQGAAATYLPVSGGGVCAAAATASIKTITNLIASPRSHRVELPVAQVEPLHLGERHGARADAVEDRDLIAALVDGAVAVEGFRDGERGPVRVARGDEARLRLRTEARIRRRPLRREQLVDLQAMLAVRDVRERRGVRGGDFHIVRVVLFAVAPRQD